MCILRNGEDLASEDEERASREREERESRLKLSVGGNRDHWGDGVGGDRICVCENSVHMTRDVPVGESVEEEGRGRDEEKCW